jgi:hypothetical protein
MVLQRFRNGLPQATFYGRNEIVRVIAGRSVISFAEIGHYQNYLCSLGSFGSHILVILVSRRRTRVDGTPQMLKELIPGREYKSAFGARSACGCWGIRSAFAFVIVTLVVMNIGCHVFATMMIMIICQPTADMLCVACSDIKNGWCFQQKKTDDTGIEPVAFRLTVKRSTN